MLNGDDAIGQIVCVMYGRTGKPAPIRLGVRDAFDQIIRLIGVIAPHKRHPACRSPPLDVVNTIRPVKLHDGLRPIRSGAGICSVSHIVGMRKARKSRMSPLSPIFTLILVFSTGEG